jgi:calcineurin-like phosphoesterase family protein
LFHFPVESWHGVGKGAWHLHGHCHGNLQQPKGILLLDVGVDNHDFKPWSVDEIADYMESQLQSVKGKFWTPNDHHQAKGEM